jgi:hypothetical protein
VIHDVDLIESLVAQIKAAAWVPSDLTADVRRVWGGDVHQSQLLDRLLVVQLWPQDGHKHERRARAGDWSLAVNVSIGFYLRVSSISIGEVDAVMRALDELAVAEWWNVVLVESADKTESAYFCREPSVTWPVRPNREQLQRAVPDGDAEQYTGVIQAQLDMTYRAA